METIAAARDLGTWAAPVRPSHESKENVYSAAAAAAAPAADYRSTNTPLPRYTPLSELPNGRGRGNDAYPLSVATAATSSPAAVAAGAASPVGWRGFRLGSGTKEIRVGGSSGRPRGYQRSSSDVAGSVMCRGGYGAAPPPRGGVMRGGIDRGGGGVVGGRRRAAAAAAASSAAASDDMHLAAAAVARARRGRLSSRF